MALRKLQYFFTKIMGPRHFFDGSGLNFFCSVNAPCIILKNEEYFTTERSLYRDKTVGKERLHDDPKECLRRRLQLTYRIYFPLDFVRMSSRMVRKTRRKKFLDFYTFIIKRGNKATKIDYQVFLSFFL